MNFDQFMCADNACFDIMQDKIKKEAFGTVCVDFEGYPLVKQVDNRYFVWLTETVAITDRHSYAWEISAQAAEAFKSYKVNHDPVAFRSFFNGHEVIINLWDHSVVFSKKED